VDRREPRRPGELQAHAGRAGLVAGRDRRQGAAVAHGLDQDRVLSGSGDLELLLELADLADGLTLPSFAEGGIAVGRKEDRSPVTALDREVERALRERLAQRRPDDAILGEELGGDERAVPGRRWVLDPLDGTAQFVRGIPVWGTQVTLEVDGRPVAAVMSAPALRRRWWGAVADGAWADAMPARVSGVARLEDAGLGLQRLGELGDGAPRERLLGLAARCDAPGGYESFWGAALVAQGALDLAVMVDPFPWDLAPARALVEAAGGRCTLVDLGSRGGRPGALLSNVALHDAALALLTAGG
jgi:histidinol-phosphatase